MTAGVSECVEVAMSTAAVSTTKGLWRIARGCLLAAFCLIWMVHAWFGPLTVGLLVLLAIYREVPFWTPLAAFWGCIAILVLSEQGFRRVVWERHSNGHNHRSR